MNCTSKSLTLLGLFIALFSFSTGRATAQAAELLFFQQTTGNIYTIDQSSGASYLVASESGHYWNGAAYDPANGLVYVDDVGTANELGSLADGAAFNKIYSFNPGNPGAGVSLVGTINTAGGTPSSLFDAAIHSVSGVETYYTIPINTTTLNTYTFPSGGGVTLGSSITLGGLTAANTASASPVAVSGLLLGDVDFVGSSIYIYGLAITTTSGTTYETNMLYRYTIGSYTAPTLAIAEGAVGGAQIGAGLSYNSVTGKLEATDTNNNLYSIDPTTGAESVLGSGMITGPDTGGNGDYTVAIVPEPSPFYGIALILLVAVGVKVSRRFQPKLARA